VRFSCFAAAAGKRADAKQSTEKKSKYSFHTRASLEIIYLFAQNKLMPEF
jgi:hypothetical protein